MKSRLGFGGADDPAYEHELGVLEELCRKFLDARERGDFDACLLLCGQMTAQHATIYKLSPPAGILDPATLFRRDETT